jgi:hypothetical protein
MVEKDIKIYLIENDHKFQEYCKEKNFSPNNVPVEKFIDVAEDIGWVMTMKEFEMHHNTRTLPDYYYIRIN